MSSEPQHGQVPRRHRLPYTGAPAYIKSCRLTIIIIVIIIVISIVSIIIVISIIVIVITIIIVIITTIIIVIIFSLHVDWVLVS